MTTAERVAAFELVGLERRIGRGGNRGGAGRAVSGDAALQGTGERMFENVR